ncbi:MAG TPA: hypothetical protein VK211_21775 [Kamptonema sp.]|nr:hypothetical protein [Kamptonema sp.]
MNSNTGFILKVVLISAALSLAIKYGGPILSIPSSNAIALIAVLTPSIILATLLSWKALSPLKSS